MEPKNIKIAVVDDDIEIQDLVTAFFRPRGGTVICFSDAEAALAEANKSGSSWDVVLTDLNLPEMSGVELTVEIKKILPITPVILITTNKSAEKAIEAIEKGAYDFIVKPIHFPQLQISVERAHHLKQLNNNLIDLHEKVKNAKSNHSEIIGRSPKFVAAMDIAKRVAKSKANIFISGESGTGKEVFAKLIHSESGLKGSFVAINCSAIPENLLESELFGHAKGSFTGAQDKKLGLFEEAEDGTLFLDEIGDLSPSLQAKLLRVLQEKKIKRVGENQYRTINCRVISATHKNLIEEIKNGTFREDLYFRLNVIPISIPSLKDRREDIIPLAESFLKRFSKENNMAAKSFSKEALKFIIEEPWKGNVRELENAIERSVVLSTTPEIQLSDIKILNHNYNNAIFSSKDTPQVFIEDSNHFILDCTTGLPTYEEVMNKFIEFAVNKNQGAQDRTAKELGIDRKTLYKRLKLAANNSNIEESIQ